jgi:uncharacterized protein YdaU (DUF1376 family)
MAKEPTLSMLPWFPRDYLAATRGMTLAERGAYTDLLWYAWDMGALPNDPKRLARMLGVDADEFDTVWPAIKLKFVLTETGIVNERLERERRYSVEMRKKALARAQLGGKATKEKWQKDREGMAASLATSHATSQATSPDDQVGLQARLKPGSPIPIPNPQSPSKAPAPSQSLRRGEDARRGEPTEAPTVEPPNLRGATKVGNGKTPEQRADAIRAVIKNCPEYRDAEVAHVAHASLEGVQKVRREQQ